MLVAKGLAAHKMKIQTILIFIILLDSVLVTTSYTLNTENDQWREVANFIDQNANPTDLILVSSLGASFASLQLPFEFYFQGKNTVYGVQTSSNLNEIIGHYQYPNTWLIIWGFTDPLNIGLFTQNNLLKNEFDKTWRLLLCKEYVSQSIINSISFIKYPLINVVYQEIVIYYYTSQ